MLVILALGALCAALALLMARMQLAAAAHVLAIASALCGLTAFLAVAASTVRRARQLPRGPGRS